MEQVKSYIIRAVSVLGETSFFESAKEASQKLDVDQTCISRALNGVQKTAGGFVFSTHPRVYLVRKLTGEFIVAENLEHGKLVDVDTREEVRRFKGKLDISEPYYKAKFL